MVDILMTGEKVSSKSTPYFCVNPFATSLALNLSILPSDLSLSLYTHLQPMGFLCAGKGTTSQVSLSVKAFSSYSIALTQF